MAENNGSIMIEGRENVLVFRQQVIAHSLAFEIKTGMKMSRVSALKAAQGLGYTGRTKKGALQWMIDNNLAQISERVAEALK